MKFISHLEGLPNTRKLKDFIRRMNTGFNNIQNENQEGIRFVRTQNVRPVYLDTDDATFTTDAAIRVAPVGSLLFTRIGVNVGEVSFNNFANVAISDNVICAELFDERLAYYIAIFLSTDNGKILLERQKRDTARPIISYENIKNLKIPILPNINVVIKKFEAAYAAKRAKEAQAAGLLASIDGYLLEVLGIRVSELTEKKKAFWVCSDKVSGGRLDPNAYNPERLLAIKAIEEGKFAAYKLKHLVYSAKTIVTESDKLPYIGLENIESNTGRFIEKNERDSFGSAVWFSKGQILFPKLRPYLNKVYLADFEGVCSTEFHVFDSQTSGLSNEFLSIFLRSKIVVSQTKYLMSGNTLPRLQTEDIENLLIPMPPLAIQTEIASKIEALRAQAQKLETEAKAEVEASKKEVEAMIFGGGGSA